MKIKYFVLLIAIALLVATVAATALTTDKSDYQLGDIVRVSSENLPGNNLIIKNRENSYMFIGDLRTSTQFIPRETGTHQISLEDRSGNEIEKTSFTVHEKLQKPVNITLEKNAFDTGELVRISINGEIQGGTELRIISPRDSYVFLDIKPELQFVPRETGEYSVMLIEDGKQLYQATFTTANKPEPKPDKKKTDSPTQLQPVPAVTAQNIKPSLKSEKTHFRITETPSFQLDFSQDTSQSNTLLTAQSARETKVNRFDSGNETVIAIVTEQNGTLSDIPAEITREKNGIYTIAMQEGRSFRPGKYRINVQLVKDGQTFIQEQDFTWGVLAVNTNKSVFLPNEDALIAIGVLDDGGHIACNARVTLTINDPAGQPAEFSTDAGTIQVSDECSFLGVTNLPDYYTTYRTNGQGTYSINLTAETDNGVRSISDTFIVQNSVEFDVARNGPTRIYPAVPYTMNFTITPAADFTGQMAEYVPSSFEITLEPGMLVTTVGDTKIISWNVQLKAGQAANIAYKFDPPDISPEFYLLGALKIGSWTEARQWQIASDALVLGAGEKEVSVLRAQGCNLAINTVTPQTFSDACAGAYPSQVCGTTTDRLSCNDGTEEAPKPSNNAYGGANITAFNTTIQDCASVISVRICHNWKLGASFGTANCNIGTHEGDAVWTTNSVSCATTTASGLICTDVTSNEPWQCSNFFGNTGNRAGGMIELQHTGGGAARDLLIDALYFNVTYFVDDVKPNISVLRPGSNVNISGNFLLNASVNDSSTVLRSNLTIYNNTGNATSTLKMTLGAGTSSAGYWNITFDSATLSDGFYNISVNATDAAFRPNSGLSSNTSITIDNTKPNATMVTPINISNLTGNFAINASVNDSPAGVFNATFMLFNSTHNVTQWLYSTRSSGSIAAGYWNTTADVSSMADGYYNITVNATDFAGNQIMANISQFLLDRLAPNATSIIPANDTNFTTNFLINASVNDSLSKVFNATFRIINPQTTTSWIYAALGSGSATAGYWNTTISVASVSDGRYNITINATDFAGNQKLVNISSFAIDRAAPSATIVAPVNNSNFSQNFLINASVNDSVTGVFNATFMLFNSTHNVTEWLYASRGSGSIYQGYWNATVAAAALADGHYNITINATDYLNNQFVANISSVIVDRTNPNVTAILPYNDTNFTGDFLINASVNDSITGIFNASFRLISPEAVSPWLYAERSSGSVYQGYWNTTFNSATIPDGAYNITINATDFASNTVMANLSTITIDNTNPNATITLPLNGINLTIDFLINASVNDSSSGVFNTTFRLMNSFVTTAWIYATRSSGGIYQGYWNSTATVAAIADGYYNITVNATDFAGRQLIANISGISVDRASANVTAIRPANVTNTSTNFLINASVNDSVSKVFNATFRLSNTQTTTQWIYATLNSGSISAGYWNATASIAGLNDNLYNVTINATDFAGNQVITNISEVLIDRQRANVSLVTPANGSILSKTEAITSIANDSSSGIQSVRYRLINESVTSSWVDAALNSGSITSGLWTANFNTFLLVNGVYNITANATDFAGNQYLVNISNVEVNNIIDLVAPNVTIIFPLLKSNISGFLLVNASINDTLGSVAGANLTVYNNTGNATAWISMTLSSGTAAAGHWNATFDSTALPDGYYNLSVNTTDVSDNANTSANISIIIDNTLPNSSMVTPINGSNFTSDFLINSSANDSLSKVMNVSFRLTGVHAASQWIYPTLGSGNILEGYWNATFKVSAIADGFYNVTVNTTDFAGNSRITNLSEVRIDREAPNASIVAPANLTNLTKDFLINASVNDSVSGVFNATFRLMNSFVITQWHYAELSSGDRKIGHWNATFAAATVPDGAYNITINATDYVGNQRIVNISEITIDRTNPNTTAIIPSNNTNFSTNFLINASVNDSLSGIFNSTFRLINSITATSWIYAERSSGSIYSGYWNATVTVATVTDGFYNITINATDFAHNWKLINISQVAVDKQRPNITIVAPANTSNLSADFLINASVNDSVSGVYNVTFKIIGPETSGLLPATRNTGTITTGYWNATFAVATVPDGFYNITTNITDFAGNNEMVNITSIRIDRAAPNISIVTPINLSNHTANFLINASVNDSVSRVFNATFRLTNNDGSTVTEWLYAERNGGSATAGYWNATFSVATVPDGFYNITVNATDFAGNQKVENLSFIRIDKAAPNATGILPLNNTNATADFQINASVNDSVSGVFNVSFRLMNSQTTTSWIFSNLNTGSRTTGYWNSTFSVASAGDGIYNITVNATDYAGNQRITNISYLSIDRLAPNVTGVVPTNGSQKTGNMLINASVNDSISKIKTVRYRLITDDQLTVTEWITATRNSGTITAGYWNITFDTTSVGDDTYNITIEATDFAGNQKLSNMSTILVTNNDILAAGENEAVALKAQACNREQGTISQTFSLACASAYPAACPSDRLSCNDGTSETSTLAQNDFGGVNISAYNSAVNNCLSIKSVRMCYEWSTSDTRTYSQCSFGVDKAGDLSWTTAAANCPTATADIVTCVDITTFEAAWNCQDFFGRSTPAVWGYIEGKRTQTGSSHTMNVDSLYFNVTYVRDNQAPSVIITNPAKSANISGTFIVNATITDTGAVSKVNLTIYNNTGNATGRIIMSLGTGTLTTGTWNATFDSTPLRDSKYNLSVNATDATGNINISENHSITIDNTAPNISIVTPQNNTVFAALNVTINASSNDSLSGIFNVSYRLSNSSYGTEWRHATLDSGTILVGYWNATFIITGLASGQYNVTANVTDFALNQRIVNISTINISRSDLTLNSSGIIFVNTSPVEEQNVTINATVHNIGKSDAVGFLVEFFNESVANSNRISNATVALLRPGGHVIVNTTYIAKPGPNNIFVRVDGNNSLSEDNETNNQANNTLSVPGYSFYYGNFSRITLLASARNDTLKAWETTNDSGNIYAADADSIIDFASLQALNRTISGNAASNDYAEADRLLNMTNFSDSITRIYTNDNGKTPHTTITITAYSTIISDVPATNSTNSSSFLTGILWDTSDDSGNGEFDDTDAEDLVFVTTSDAAQNGKFGFYSAELRVPTSLKRYVQPNSQNNLVFYTELT